MIDITKREEAENQSEIGIQNLELRGQILDIQVLESESQVEIDKIRILLKNQEVSKIKIQIPIADLEEAERPYWIEELSDKVISRRYRLGNDLLSIFGRRNIKYRIPMEKKERFDIEIYFKNKITQEDIIVKRNVYFEYERAGIFLWVPSI